MLSTSSNLLQASSKLVCTLFSVMPIFFHWFGLQVYKAYMKAQCQIKERKKVIELEINGTASSIQKHALERVVAAIDFALKLKQDKGCSVMRT